MQSHSGDSFAVDRGSERRDHRGECKESKYRADALGLCKGVAVRNDSRVTANLALRTVGEDSKDGLTFEIRDCKGYGWNVGDVTGLDGSDAAGNDRNTAVQWTGTVDELLAYAKRAYQHGRQTFECWPGRG